MEHTTGQQTRDSWNLSHDTTLQMQVCKCRKYLGAVERNADKFIFLSVSSSHPSISQGSLSKFVVLEQFHSGLVVMAVKSHDRNKMAWSVSYLCCL